MAAACVSDVVKKRCTVSSGWVLWFARLKMRAGSRAARSTEESSSAVDSWTPNLIKVVCIESRH